MLLQRILNHLQANRKENMRQFVLRLVFSLSAAATAFVSSTALAIGQSGPPIPAVFPDAPGVTFTGSTRLQEYMTYLQAYQMLQTDMKILESHNFDLTAAPGYFLHVRKDYDRIQSMLAGDQHAVMDNTAKEEDAQLSQDVSDLDNLISMGKGPVGRNQLMQVSQMVLTRIAADQQKQRALLISQIKQQNAVSDAAATRILEFMCGKTGHYHGHL